MAKKIYLTILTIVTVVCIIAGSIYHITGWGRNFAVRVVPFLEDGTISDWSSEFSSNSHSSSDAGTSSDSQSFSDSGEMFSAISIDAEVMDLEIVSGNRSGISFSGSESLRPQLEIKDGVLTLTQKKPKKNWLHGLNKCDVKLTVPSDLTFTSIDIRSAVGDVDISRIKAAKLTVKASVGDIDIEDCEFEDVMIDASVGDTDIDNCDFLRLAIDASVGDISVDGTPDLSEYAISMGTSIGEVKFNGGSFKRNFQQTGSADKYIKISNSTGDISVDKQK